MNSEVLWLGSLRESMARGISRVLSELRVWLMLLLESTYGVVENK